jgi:NAD(P)-dependent dehydrogenase (short-subunit alcohol dehydrogenase family)
MATSEPAASGALVGKVAVVSGATSGSGRAIARRFVAEGAEVVLLARGKERLMADAAALGSRALPIATDVGDPESVAAAFAEIADRYGRIDILVNNAAVYRPCAVEHLSDGDIEQQVRTNYLGPIYTCRAAIRLLKAAGGGDILNTSSESTLDPFPMLSVYVSSKAGLEAFSRTLATEVQDDDIRVTVVVGPRELADRVRALERARLPRQDDRTRRERRPVDRRRRRCPPVRGHPAARSAARHHPRALVLNRDAPLRKADGSAGVHDAEVWTPERSIAVMSPPR